MLLTTGAPYRCILYKRGRSERSPLLTFS
jgi:hypothetical protein